jgi:ABC-type lipoprotein export system ATPase subunit
MLAALDEPTGGSIAIGNVDLDHVREDELRRHLAYVVSEPGFTRGFALDVLTLGRAHSREPLDDLAALGMTSERTTRFEELSRGERVRVALVRALLTEPDVYLLDEPTAGLGNEETNLVLDLLARTGATIIVASHDQLVIDWSDDVYELRDAALVAVTR